MSSIWKSHVLNQLKSIYVPCDWFILQCTWWRCYGHSKTLCRCSATAHLVLINLSTSVKMTFLPPSSIRIQLKRLIKNNAVYEKRSTYRRCCWYVHEDALSRFGLETLPVPCQWTYLTTGAREESREEPQAATGSQGNSPTTPQTSSTTSSSSNKRKSAGSMSITKFMKRCTDPEQVDKCDILWYFN